MLLSFCHNGWLCDRVLLGCPSSTSTNGSSPRARGARERAECHRLRARLIPASAGNTQRSPWALTCPPAYPRERGAPRGVLAAVFGHDGSSPRARGTRVKHHSGHGRLRLIPASAANPAAPPAPPARRPADPREHGEHPLRLHNAARPRGSSPRARGTPCKRHHLVEHRRLIPASAGNTSPAPGWAAR